MTFYKLINLYFSLHHCFLVYLNSHSLILTAFEGFFFVHYTDVWPLLEMGHMCLFLWSAKHSKSPLTWSRFFVAVTLGSSVSRPSCYINNLSLLMHPFIQKQCIFSRMICRIYIQHCVWWYDGLWRSRGFVLWIKSSALGARSPVFKIQNVFGLSWFYDQNQSAAFSTTKLTTP